VSCGRSAAPAQLGCHGRHGGNARTAAFTRSRHPPNGPIVGPVRRHQVSTEKPASESPRVRLLARQSSVEDGVAGAQRGECVETTRGGERAGVRGKGMEGANGAGVAAVRPEPPPPLRLVGR